MRKKTIFTIRDEIIKEVESELDYFGIEEIKEEITFETDCNLSDIEVNIIEDNNHEFSRIDLSPEGLIYWDCLYPKVLTGVTLILDEDFEEFLDLVLKNGIEEYLIIN